MIQFEKNYDINDGNGSVMFKKVDDLTVEAVYNRGTIKGAWDGETLKGTFIDNASNGNGLIHFTFSDNGFEAKWKAGLDEGPMKGKWKGQLITLNSENDNISKQLNSIHFAELIGNFSLLAFNFDNTEEAIEQGGDERFKIIFDINNQVLISVNQYIDETERCSYYTGSSIVEFYEDHISNEYYEFPGYTLITDLDTDGFATWEIPFHGGLENVSYGKLSDENYSILKLALTPNSLYKFLNEASSFLKKN